MKELIKTMNPVSQVNIKTALLDAERLKQSVTFFTHSRRYLDRYRVIDTPLKPFTLNAFVVNSGLIYYKVNQFEWKTFSLDDVDKIQIF